MLSFCQQQYPVFKNKNLEDPLNTNLQMDVIQMSPTVVS